MTESKCPETWVNESNPADPNLYGVLADFCLIAMDGHVDNAEWLKRKLISNHPGLMTIPGNLKSSLNSEGIRWFLSRYPEQFDQFASEILRKLAAASMREVIAVQRQFHAEREAEQGELSSARQRIAQLEAEVDQLLKRIDELEDKLDKKTAAVKGLQERIADLQLELEETEIVSELEQDR